MLALTARSKDDRPPGLLVFAVSLLLSFGCPDTRAELHHPTKGSFEVWQVERNWQRSTVTSIVQSRDGYLWLGTYHGLARFDGDRFMVFDSVNSPGLQSSAVTCLFEGTDGVLWIGHETGQLTRFATGQFQAVHLGRAWPGGSIEAMATDEEGDLWLLSVKGHLFRVRDGRVVDPPTGASPAHPVTFARSRSGKIWTVCNGVVFMLERGALAPFNVAGSVPGEYFERVLPSRDGGLWVVASGRLRKWRDGFWSPEETVLPGGAGAVTCLLETRSGQVLAGTLRNGLCLLVPGAEPLQFTRDDGLSHDWIRALCEDHEGNLWLGTAAGFDGLRPRKVQMLNPPDSFRGCAVLSFTVRPDGSAWIGTEGAGLYHFNDGQWTAFREAAGVSNLFVWSVLDSRQYGLLAGTWGGGVLAREGDHFGPAAGLITITSPARALREDRRGALWIGTTTGLYRYETNRLTWFAGADQLLLPDVRTIVEGDDRTVWFGMAGGGLGRVRNGRVTQYGPRDGLGGKSVECLYAEVDGTLWIGTSDYGLTRFKNGRFSVLTTTNGLPTRVINQIVDDGAGSLWLGSQAGILHASKVELNRCADGQVGMVRFLIYGKAEGLSSELCYGGFYPGASRGADGRLWFPTAKGLAIVDPGNATTNMAKPPVAIEQMLVDSKPIEPYLLASRARASGLPGEPGDTSMTTVADASRASTNSTVHFFTGSNDRLRIPPGSRRFEFQYAGMSFVAPDKMAFKHKLEGLDREWQDAGPQRVATYGYLPPGQYTFRVIACNNDNLWNETGASLSFLVEPFFWQTWWFQSVGMVCGAAAVGLGVRSVTRRRLRRRFEQLERQRALERERARIARDIHDDLGASLTRITLLSQSVRSDVEGQPQTAADVDQIYGTARELTRAMDEIVWAVNPTHDTLDSLVTYLGRYAQKFLSTAGIRCRLDVPVNLPAWALTSEVRHNVFLAMKEALHNVVKHAGATEVRIVLELQARGFVLLVADNGRGFEWRAFNAHSAPAADATRPSGGNGLSNMLKRLEEIGGRCEWETAPNEGTRVKLIVKVGAGPLSNR